MNLESKPIKPTDLLKKELEADLANGFEKTNKSLPIARKAFVII